MPEGMEDKVWMGVGWKMPEIYILACFVSRSLTWLLGLAGLAASAALAALTALTALSVLAAGHTHEAAPRTEEKQHESGTGGQTIRGTQENTA